MYEVFNVDKDTRATRFSTQNSMATGVEVSYDTLLSNPSCARYRISLVTSWWRVRCRTMSSRQRRRASVLGSTSVREDYWDCWNRLPDHSRWWVLYIAANCSGKNRSCSGFPQNKI